jgi:hypothetical protein
MRCRIFAPTHLMARWQSGYAAACKAADIGSIPFLASIFLARFPSVPMAEHLDTMSRNQPASEFVAKCPLFPKADAQMSEFSWF